MILVALFLSELLLQALWHLTVSAVRVVLSVEEMGRVRGEGAERVQAIG